MASNPLQGIGQWPGNYMSEEEANHLIRKYDKNGDSILTKDELTALIIDQAASLQRQKPKEEVVCKPQKVEAKVPDKKAEPFRMKLSRDEMREIFLEHDIDGDGCLSRSELAKAFSMCGFLISFNKANYALKLADADGDGHVSIDELDKVIDYAEKLNNLKR